MRFKNGPQLPGAGRSRTGHHHGSRTPNCPGTISLGKMAYHTKQIRRECIKNDGKPTHALLEYKSWEQLTLWPYFQRLLIWINESVII